jgi:chemotaxis protein CheD
VSLPAKPSPPDAISVTIGRWGVGVAPTLIRTLLGSCVSVVLYDRRLKLGGLTHIVLPDSRGSNTEPGKFADTAIPGLIAELERLAGLKLTSRLTAKILGGASMFQNDSALDIGRMNNEATERILADLHIPIIARDLGGESGRRLTLFTTTGIVAVKIPGGEEYEV